MNDNKFFIDFPSDKEIIQEINIIIEKGLPKKKSIYGADVHERTDELTNVRV